MVKEYDQGIRVQALALHSQGIIRAKILEITGYSNSGLTKLIQKAKQRGYTPGGVILAHYVENESGRGAKTKLTEEHARRLTDILTSDASSRKFSCEALAQQFNKQNTSKDADIAISAASVLRSLRTQGYKKVKSTTKSGRTSEASKSSTKPKTEYEWRRKLPEAVEERGERGEVGIAV